jgi:hypothetical protein
MLQTLKSLATAMFCEPPGNYIRKAWLKRRGSFRQKERYGLLSRPNYAYGLLRAADLARFAGKDAATVCEFGVATGDGLMNMVELAGLVRAATGVELRVVGLDSGSGLPAIDGCKDHPEIWSVGDFAMTNRAELIERIGDRAELIFGDIKDTVDDFIASIDPDAPLGFVSIDVDVYSAAKSALRCLQGEPEKYVPAVSIYCDDVQFFFANRWCGELCAIAEFNEENEVRKIDSDRCLPGDRPDFAAPWYRAMFVAHILDHAFRQRPRSRSGQCLAEHFALMRRYSLV